MRRWIMHVDMDAFYASVEQRDHPEWRGKPVIVGGRSRRGVVATASYEARAFGVHSAMPAVKARELCPDAIFTAPRFEVYKTVSAEIHEIMLHYAVEIEPLSLDEAFMDISGLCGKYETLGAVGRAIKAEIKEKRGLWHRQASRPINSWQSWQAIWISLTVSVLSLMGKKRKSLHPFPCAVCGA